MTDTDERTTLSLVYRTFQILLKIDRKMFQTIRDDIDQTTR